MSEGTGRRACSPAKLIRAAAVVLLFCGAARAAPTLHYGDRGLPLDPVFNLPYDGTQVHFDYIESSRVRACAPLLGSLAPGRGRLKLFGELVRRGSSIFILGDESPGAQRGLSGIVLVMRGGGCRTSGPLLALRRTTVNDPDLAPGLSAEDVTALLKDLFRRYARAFGSKAAFLTWADRLTHEAECARRTYPDMPCPLLYTSLFTPEMRQALEQFRESQGACDRAGPAAVPI